MDFFTPKIRNRIGDKTLDASITLRQYYEPKKTLMMTNKTNFKTGLIYFCFYSLFFFVTGFGSGVNYSNPSFFELSESDPDRIGTEPQP